jgi:hypothetical protein
MADPRNPKPEKDWWKTNAPITNSIANFLATPFISSYNQVFNPKPVDPKLQGFTRFNEQLKYDQGQFVRDAYRPGLDFLNTVTNFATSQAQPAPGQGLGSRMFPANPSATGATGQGQPGGWSTSYGSAAQAGNAGMNQGAPKPPGGIPLTRPGSPQAGPKRFTAEDLYIDPTPAFQPVLDQYAKQQAQLQDRYGVNQADIKNIFGNLTTVRALDKTKIAQQYQTSIQQQQDALAARTAETRMATQAGQQGAATAAGEMGTAGQPAPTDSLTARAAEEGVADSNAYQTTWAALQNVMSQQAQNDVQAAVQGYDYQQTSALEQLRNNLEDRLAAIQGNVAGTQSQLAQAQLEGRQGVANAKYGEELQRRAAAQSLAAAQASAANKRPSYSSDAFGLQQRAADAGIDYSQIQSTVNEAYNSAYALLNPEGSVKKVTPKKSDILNAWNAIKGGSPQTASRLSPYVTMYVDQMF